MCSLMNGPQSSLDVLCGWAATRELVMLTREDSRRISTGRKCTSSMQAKRHDNCCAVRGSRSRHRSHCFSSKFRRSGTLNLQNDRNLCRRSRVCAHGGSRHQAAAELCCVQQTHDIHRRGEFTGRRDGHLSVLPVQQAVLGDAQARPKPKPKPKPKLRRRKETAPARGRAEAVGGAGRASGPTRE